ncbi:MAG: hypothetical protein U0164_08275 [Gemmatimonadaceae bacterium]
MSKLWEFEIWSPGDQVKLSPILIGFVVMPSVGNSRSSWARPGYCVCPPPRLNVTGPRPVVKFIDDRIVCSACAGLKLILRWMTVFVE